MTTHQAYLDLLAKYEDAARTVYGEFSGNFDKSEEELQAELHQLRSRWYFEKEEEL